MTRLGLELHPDKTRKADLSSGKEGFDFLGCHLRKRMSGPIWERTRKRVLPPALARRSRDEADPAACEGSHSEVALPRGPARCHRAAQPVLRGWGQYFRTGNADVKFNRLDEYVHRRLRALRVKRAGSKLKADKPSAGPATTS
ncbi:MAG: hypothetical protein IPG04_27705 [Polyangiaceae bacterium]|nr:hypothetical protein [Polyangiaceae bacterium]